MVNTKKSVKDKDLKAFACDFVSFIRTFLPLNEFISISETCKKELYSGSHSKVDGLLKLIDSSSSRAQIDLTLATVLRKSSIRKSPEIFVHDSGRSLLITKMNFLVRLPAFLAALLEHGALDQAMINLALSFSITSPTCKIDLAKLLIEKGANVNREGGRLLFDACLDLHYPAIKLLVENGGDVNRVDQDNCNCLMIAVRNGCSLGMFEYLIRGGASINLLDKDLRSTLHIAACNGQYKIYLRLLDLGLDSLLLDSMGRTACWILVGCTPDELVTLQLEERDVVKNFIKS